MTLPELKTTINRLEQLPFEQLDAGLRRRIVKLGTDRLIEELTERLNGIPFTPAEAALDMSELAGDMFLHPAVLTEES